MFWSKNKKIMYTPVNQSFTIVNAKNLAPLFLSIFFWIKIDDIKNQCSLVFMSMQKTIFVEKKVCMKSCLHFYEKNVKS